ncbi:MAG: FKBP-type peptidyl-prolyl cis-trans isomerase N-terminal domain-containing protein [Phycisphaerae bacterium]
MTKTELDSYALGIHIARGLKKQSIPIDLEGMTRGFKDGQAFDVSLATRPVGPPASTPATGPAAIVGYEAGFETAKAFKVRKVELDWNMVAQGVRDVVDGKEIAIPEANLKQVLEAFTNEMVMSSRAARIAIGQANRKEGDEFLATNTTQPGVNVLPSGVQYKILKIGQGKVPTATDTVEINCRGSLVNGTVFEDTYATGQPATLALAGTPPPIAGLREVLKMMPVGSKWRIFIPPIRAYLDRGKGKLIGPYATLIYEIELLRIKPPATQASQPSDPQPGGAQP